MIFEDSDESPISQLLQKCMYKKFMHFSGGNGRLSSKLLEVYTSEDEFWIFIDLAPNNKYVVEKYTLFCDEYEQYSNVYVFPIICMEEVLLTAIRKYNYLQAFTNVSNMVDNLVYKFDWSNVDSRYKNLEYISNSLEHAYKYILSQSNMPCFRNNKGNAIVGKFYLEGCNCDRKFCRVDSELSISAKAETLYVSLPIFVALNSEHIKFWEELELRVRKVTKRDVFAKLQEKFNIICESMGVAQIILYFKQEQIIKIKGEYQNFTGKE